MRELPMLFLCPFGPTPKPTLSDSCRFVRPNVFVQIDAVASCLINHQLQLMRIMRNWFVSIDFCRKVSGGNLGLTHSHVAHLRPVEVHAVANGVYPVVAGNTHGPIDVDVSFVVCDSKVGGCRGALK